MTVQSCMSIWCRDLASCTNAASRDGMQQLLVCWQMYQRSSTYFDKPLVDQHQMLPDKAGCAVLLLLSAAMSLACTLMIVCWGTKLS